MLDVYERKALRKMQEDPVKKNDAWRILFNHDLKQVCRELMISDRLQRLRWAGHVGRMEETKIPRRAIKRQFLGRRNKRSSGYGGVTT